MIDSILGLAVMLEGIAIMILAWCIIDTRRDLTALANELLYFSQAQRNFNQAQLDINSHLMRRSR